VKLALVAVGKVRDKGLARLAADYTKRIARFVPFVVHDVKDGRVKDAQVAKKLEGERLLGKLPAGAHVVLMDERGETLTSVQISERIDLWTRSGKRDVRFVLGGPDGFSSAVRSRANASWRLSSLTLPHELARVVLLEQVYRAWTILRGIPYHKD
jgi:23S rRNA (pseudouridine1915-N3)-methyltransferase